MAIIENKDYVFCPAATYIGAVGVGKGCLVGTSRFLLGLPERIDSGTWNRCFTTTTYSIAGMTPGEAIQGVATLDEMTLDLFEQSMIAFGESCKGAVFVDLESQKRLKLRSGLCTKGIYWSQRESGPGWKGYGLGSKELTEQWIKFYSKHPISI